MKVYIKNNILSLGGSSSVVDEQGRPVYNVKGKLVTWRAKKTVCDATGRKLYTLKSKLINWFTHKIFIYDANGRKVAKVRDKFWSLKNVFLVKGVDGDLRIAGEYFSLTSQIVKGNEVLGTIRRQITVFADAFELEASEENMPFCIALVIAIDNILDAKRK